MDTGRVEGRVTERQGVPEEGPTIRRCPTPLILRTVMDGDGGESGETTGFCVTVSDSIEGRQWDRRMSKVLDFV